MTRTLRLLGCLVVVFFHSVPDSSELLQQSSAYEVIQGASQMNDFSRIIRFGVGVEELTKDLVK